MYSETRRPEVLDDVIGHSEIKIKLEQYLNIYKNKMYTKYLEIITKYYDTLKPIMLIHNYFCQQDVVLIIQNIFLPIQYQ